MALPEQLPAGDYRLMVGWYQPTTNVRLLLGDTTDAVELAQWTVQ